MTTSHKSFTKPESTPTVTIPKYDFKENPLSDTTLSSFITHKTEGLTMRFESVEAHKNGFIAHLAGQLDNYNSSQFQANIAEAIRGGYSIVIIDCSAVNYMSSTGVGSFTAIQKALKDQKGTVMAYGLQRRVFEVFQLLGFTSFFDFYETKASALASISGQASIIEEKKPSAFPLLIACPICVKKYRVAKEGKYRCSACNFVFGVNQSGKVSEFC